MIPHQNWFRSESAVDRNSTENTESHWIQRIFRAGNPSEYLKCGPGDSTQSSECDRMKIQIACGEPAHLCVPISFFVERAASLNRFDSERIFKLFRYASVGILPPRLIGLVVRSRSRSPIPPLSACTVEYIFRLDGKHVCGMLATHPQRGVQLRQA